MSFLPDGWRRKPVALNAEMARRLAVWQAQIMPKAKVQDAVQGRLVVVDVETSGLSLAQDRLISIAAIAITGQVIRLGETFETVLQQDTASTADNILLHGVSGAAQVAGESPALALLKFLEFVGTSPIVAYHAAFDEGMICKAILTHLGFKFRGRWLDLADLAPAFYPEWASRLRSLDDWSDHFHIPNPVRHNAMFDAFATAQLALIVFSQAQRRGISRVQGLLDMQAMQRFRTHP
jgi:DNA polymerase III subunit epsilon